MKVLLLSVGNPDFGQNPSQPMPNVPVEEVKVKDITHASQVCRAYIHKYSLGSGNWSGGKIIDRRGQEVARVSYNGKVWPPGAWRPDMEPLFDPAKQPPIAPPQYHLLNYLGVYKKTIRKNFENSAVQDDKVAALIYRPGQVYTVEELKQLSGYLWTAHDECVDANPGDYNPLQVKTAREKIEFGRLVLEKIRELESLERCRLV